MSDERVYKYEGMFLFPQSATANLQAAVDHVKDLISRADGQIISFRKWDERRLAYDIKGNKRGVYFLTYFNAPAAKLADLERACNLSEQLLRSMILRADDVPMEQVEAADGQAELADEIKLRGEQDQQQTTTDGTSSVTRRSESEPTAAATPSIPSPTTMPRTAPAPEPVSVSASGDDED